jgi:hypothetical protein
MSTLQSKDATIDVLIGLEDAYERTAVAEADAHSPLERSEPGRARLIRTEFDMQLAMCRASQLICTGDRHFKEAETGMPEDMIGNAQLAQDDYRYRTRGIPAA